MEGEGIEIGKRGLPKLREMLRRQRTDSDVNNMGDSPDFSFVYDDADLNIMENAELYSYTEELEFHLNRKAFEQLLAENDLEKWQELTEAARCTHLLRLLNGMEVCDRQKRMLPIRAILYLVQGIFGECETEEQQIDTARRNIFFLYECGAFSSVVELLNMEIENGIAASAALRKPAVSLADSADLRAFLNILYTMVETMRIADENDTDRMKQLRENFCAELSLPMFGEETLAVILFGMVSKFCSGTAPHFPMKKVLLLLWKVILVSLGGLDDVHQAKNKKRSDEGLPLLTEDTTEVCKNMRAASPPASAADLIDQQQPKRSYNRGIKKGYNPSLQGLMKQSSMEGPYDDGNGEDDITRELENNHGSDDDLPPTPPRPPSPMPAKSLPWTPKVRQKDLENFFEHTRAKFVGFQVKNDSGSLAGLPLPIHEGVKVLKQHLYVSLSEIQIKKKKVPTATLR